MVRAFGAFFRSLGWGLAIGTDTRGPEARSITAWGNAPGVEAAMLSRAEGPIHPDGETVQESRE